MKTIMKLLSVGLLGWSGFSFSNPVEKIDLDFFNNDLAYEAKIQENGITYIPLSYNPSQGVFYFDKYLMVSLFYVTFLQLSSASAQLVELQLLCLLQLCHLFDLVMHVCL